MSDETGFQIVGVGMAPASARGLRVRVKPVENGKRHYTINGRVKSTDRPALRGLNRYTVSCQDVYPPGFLSLYEGRQVQIVALEVCQSLTDAPDLLLDPLAGTDVVYTDDEGNEVAQAQATWAYYQPGAIDVVIDSIDTDHAEYDQQIGWTIEFLGTRL